MHCHWLRPSVPSSPTFLTLRFHASLFSLDESSHRLPTLQHVSKFMPSCRSRDWSQATSLMSFAISGHYCNTACPSVFPSCPLQSFVVVLPVSFLSGALLPFSHFEQVVIDHIHTHQTLSSRAEVFRLLSNYEEFSGSFITINLACFINNIEIQICYVMHNGKRLPLNVECYCCCRLN